MTQTFTKQLNEVVRYVYDETNNLENLEIEKCIASDMSLLDFYLDSMHLKSEMSKIRRKPSEECVANILAFSKNYQPVI